MPHTFSYVYLAVKCALSEDQADNQLELETNVIIEAEVLEQRQGCYILRLKDRRSASNFPSSEAQEARAQEKLEVAETALREKTAEALSLQQSLETAETRCLALQSLVCQLREERDELYAEMRVRGSEGEISKGIIDQLESEKKELSRQMKNFGSAYQNLSSQYEQVFQELVKVKSKQMMESEKRKGDLVSLRKEELKNATKGQKSASQLEEYLVTKLELKEKELNKKHEEIKTLKELSWMNENQESHLLNQQNKDLIRRNEELQRRNYNIEMENQSLMENYKKCLNKQLELSREKFHTEESRLVKQNEELIRLNEDLRSKLGAAKSLKQQEEEDKKTNCSLGTTPSPTTTTPNDYQCFECNQEFRSEKPFLFHLIRDHTCHEDDALYFCPLCDKQFNQPVTWAQMIGHMQEHEDQV